MKNYITKEFYDLIRRKYPAIFQHEDLTRLFQYICFSGYYDTDRNMLILSSNSLRRIIYQTPGKNSIGKLLERFKAVIPDFEFSSYYHAAGKARGMTACGFDLETKRAIACEVNNLNSRNSVHYLTGKRKPVDIKRQVKNEYLRDLFKIKLNPTQQKIVDYLSQVNSAELTKKLKANSFAIEDAINNLQVEEGTNIEVAKEQNRRILAAAWENPDIHYYPGDRSCRLSPREDTVLGLSRNVRKAVCIGWYDVDLVSSQFSIISSYLKAPQCIAFIATGRKLWDELGVKGKSKDAAKDILYALCFGMNYHGLKAMERKAGLTILSHPLLKELLLFRSKWLQKIIDNGGEKDVWGNWLAISKDRDECSVAACLIQSFEMQIISPVFDVVNEFKSYKGSIKLFQHDGFTISFGNKKKKDLLFKKMCEAVQAEADKLNMGIVVRLESEELVEKPKQPETKEITYKHRCRWCNRNYTSCKKIEGSFDACPRISCQEVSGYAREAREKDRS